MTYTYKINFISQMETTLTVCGGSINWDAIDKNGFMHVKTLKGSLSINLRNVNTIEEIINED